MPKSTVKAEAGGAEVDATVDFFGFDELVRAAHVQALIQIRRTGEPWMEETRDWMQSNRPWQDRTHNARRSLGVVPHYDDVPNQISYEITGGVPYMKFLERNQAGKFAILADATHIWGNIILGRLGAKRI